MQSDVLKKESEILAQQYLQRSGSKALKAGLVQQVLQNSQQPTLVVHKNTLIAALDQSGLNLQGAYFFGWPAV